MHLPAQVVVDLNEAEAERAWRLRLYKLYSGKTPTSSHVTIKYYHFKTEGLLNHKVLNTVFLFSGSIYSSKMHSLFVVIAVRCYMNVP